MTDDRLVSFFRSLDRSRFMEESYQDLAGIDAAFPIRCGQTISQPSLVLYMTDKLRLDHTCSVLEIGTGSGYQTAFLAHFARWVHTVERIGELSQLARSRLTALGYRNISYKTGDGSSGWIEHAPFDRIIVTAAPRFMPNDLIDQLAPNGIMILPLGERGRQRLLRIERSAEGIITNTHLLDVAFVDLVGKYC